MSLCDFEFPHTATRIRTSLDEVLKEWDIPKAKVLTLTTANGIYMIIAYKRSPQANINTETDEIISDNDSDNDDYEETDKGNVEDIDDIAIKNYQNFSCVSHTLQLVVKIALNCNQFNSTIMKVQKLIHSIKKSSKASKQLVLKVGKNLIHACPTRWNSTNDMVQRMIEIKELLRFWKSYNGAVYLTVSGLNWKCLLICKTIFRNNGSIADRY